MGCCFSPAASTAYSVSPDKSVSLRASIRRRESFRHASTILVDRVARRMHKEWRESRRARTQLDSLEDGNDILSHQLKSKGHALQGRKHTEGKLYAAVASIPEETAGETVAGEQEYVPFYESIGETQVNVASMEWDSLPETLKNARLSRSRIVVEAVVAELRKLNAKAELQMQNEPKKEKKRLPGHENIDEDSEDAKFQRIRRKSINLSTDMIDNIAALEYISAERRVQSDQDQNQGQEIPWEALTEEERVAWYRTTLCTVSEWNQMMSEAEAPLDHSRSYGTAAAVSRYSVNSTPNSVTPAIGSTTPMSGMSGSAHSVSSAESDRLRLDTLEMSTVTSPMTSEPSPLAASPAFVRNVPFLG